MSIMMGRIRTRHPGWAMWPGRANDGAGMALKQYLILWSWGLQGNVGMGSVTMLTLLTSPLVWGFLIYHLWLIYCGTTTNESLKWSDLQEDMNDGFAFRRKMARGRPKDPRLEPSWTRWPVETEQVIVRTDDGKPPHEGANLPGVGEWEPVWKLRHVENLYDLGFWDNLVDALFPGHLFRDGGDDAPASEHRGPQQRRKARG
jgi:palmitoyltransferase